MIASNTIWFNQINFPHLRVGVVVCHVRLLVLLPHTTVAFGGRCFCVAGVARGDINVPFVWQVYHLVALTWFLCGRHGSYGTTTHNSFTHFVTHNIVTHNSFTDNIVTQLGHTHTQLFHAQLWHRHTHTQFFHTICLPPVPFSFLALPSHAHICFVLIGRSWHVGLSSSSLVCLDM